MIVTEYQLGKNLENIKQLNIDSALMLFSQICMAVHTIHESGYVHGDLHPKNIFIKNIDTNRKHAVVLMSNIRKKHVHNDYKWLG